MRLLHGPFGVRSIHGYCICFNSKFLQGYKLPMGPRAMLVHKGYRVMSRRRDSGSRGHVGGHSSHTTYGVFYREIFFQLVLYFFLVARDSLPPQFFH